MDLKQLEYFVRVAELQSFTRAAQLLRIAQPALSRQVRLLEVELRQNLLIRNGRGALPTEAGKLLLEHGRGILHQVLRAQEEMGRMRGGLSGRVAVGMPTSVSRMMAVPLTRAFRAQMPQATVTLQEGLSTAMLESLLNGRLDIALLYNATPQAEIELTPLLTEAVYLVQALDGDKKKVAKPKALPLAQLADFQLVIPTRPNAMRNLVEEELGKLSLRPKISIEMDGVASILELVADGAGCAILPQSAVVAEATAQRFAVTPIAGLQSNLSMAISSQRPSTLTQHAMQQIVGQMAPSLFNATK
jgi:LysR family transcriptional regulator, nitrogen assimilation regulatory protein